eukprot:2163144-Pyramimonas_sp.AAC.1
MGTDLGRSCDTCCVKSETSSVSGSLIHRRSNGRKTLHHTSSMTRRWGIFGYTWRAKGANSILRARSRMQRRREGPVGPETKGG